VNICPTDALQESPEGAKYPRVVSALFSDPNTTHTCTKVPGRGTEECKTNDVRGRVKRGTIGILIELGRPALGCTFQDISVMTSRLKELNVFFEPSNPLCALMDPLTGTFPEELQGQRLLSAIIEIHIDESKLEDVFKSIVDVGGMIDTVFSLSAICRFDQNGEIPILKKLHELGIHERPNAKVNLGMGRPLTDN